MGAGVRPHHLALSAALDVTVRQFNLVGSPVSYCLVAMNNRWSILVLLFLVRTAMAFQFQSVAALAPLVRHDLGISIADIGFLIGLYLAPGMVFAVPGGAIGQRFGDKRVVLAGLALMTAGGVIMALSPLWALQVAGRLLAGIGGVVLNVLMAKMVTDWFARRELATAMAIFVNSWPFGIALALVVLPLVAGSGGLMAGYLLTAGLTATGFAAFLALYRSPDLAAAAPSRESVVPSGRVLVAVILAGAVWGLFNAGLAVIFGFGPLLLAERGWSVAAASSTTSIVLWLVVFSVPLGGLMADRSARPMGVLVASMAGFAAMLIATTRMDNVLVGFILLGMLSGLPAGPIMSLPARVLTPRTRANGMGIFHILYYIIAVAAPWIAGIIASFAGTARATFDFGAALLIAACAAAGLFRWLAARLEPAAAPA